MSKPLPGKALVPLIILFLLSTLSGTAYCRDVSYRVRTVIDGDTIIVDGGERVRYLGINTPEAGEPFYEEAKDRNRALVGGRRVRLVICKEEERDRHGRLLAYVYAGEIDVNRTLLSEGFARRLTIPPCGLDRAAEFSKIEGTARDEGLGIWGRGKASKEAPEIAPGDAVSYLEKSVKVKGRISDVARKKGVVLLFFEGGGPFRAVVFEKDLDRLLQRGVDPLRLAGKTAVISGAVTEYRGAPEIVVRRPSQIKVLR